MDLGLTGLRAILVGASKGIGRATASLLAAEGCSVAICARGQAGVDDAVAEIRAAGGRATGAAVDVGDAGAYRAWLEQAARDLGGCDIFMSFTSPGAQPASEETWKGGFELDLMAMVRGIETVTPQLCRSKAASIVAISSTAAFEDFLAPTPYGAMKAATINYAAALSRALAPMGIRVNSVSPGPIFVEQGSWDVVKATMPQIFDSTLKSIPLGRMGTAQELAKAIAFVASPACRFMTGANLVVDGGLTKRVQY